MNCLRSKNNFDSMIFIPFVMVIHPIHIVKNQIIFLFFCCFWVHKYTKVMRKNCEKAKWSGVNDIRSTYAIPLKNMDSINDNASFSPMYSFIILLISIVSKINIVINIMTRTKSAQLLPAINDNI